MLSKIIWLVVNKTNMKIDVGLVDKKRVRNRGYQSSKYTSIPGVKNRV